MKGKGDKMFNIDSFLSYVQKYVNANGELSEDTFSELVERLDEAEVEMAIKALSDNGIDIMEDAECAANDYSDYSDLMNLNNEQLCVMYQRGDRTALDTLCVKNKKFVYKIANKVYWVYKPSTLEVEDLYTHGFIGLLKAAEKFDAGKGFKFTTYSHWWIWQTITREIMDNGSIIRLPVHMHEQISVINRCRNELIYYTMADLRDKLESDYGKVYSIEKLRELVFYADAYLNTTSLNKAIGEDGESELVDFIPADYSVEDEVTEGFVKDMIAECLSLLSEREGKVITLRFGLKSGVPMTLEAVGKEMGVTRERIRQIEMKAIRKLGRSSVCRKMEGMYAA